MGNTSAVHIANLSPYDLEIVACSKNGSNRVTEYSRRRGTTTDVADVPITKIEKFATSYVKIVITVLDCKGRPVRRVQFYTYYTHSWIVRHSHVARHKQREKTAPVEIPCTKDYQSRDKFDEGAFWKDCNYINRYLWQPVAENEPTARLPDYPERTTFILSPSTVAGSNRLGECIQILIAQTTDERRGAFNLRSVSKHITGRLNVPRPKCFRVDFHGRTFLTPRVEQRRGRQPPQEEIEFDQYAVQHGNRGHFTSVHIQSFEFQDRSRTSNIIRYSDEEIRHAHRISVQYFAEVWLTQDRSILSDAMETGTEKDPGKFVLMALPVVTSRGLWRKETEDERKEREEKEKQRRTKTDDVDYDDDDDDDDDGDYGAS